MSVIERQAQGNHDVGSVACPEPRTIFPKGHIYPIGPEDFHSLDPALAQTINDVYAIQTIFTGLVQFKDEGTVVDQLAASHSVSPDGLIYTFTLKPGLKFSDGSTLTPTNHIVPDGMVGYSQNLTGPSGVTSTQGDKTKARQLLMGGMHEAGYSSVVALPSIKFSYSTGDSAISNLVQALAQQWQTVLGITVKMEAVESNTLLQLVFSTKGNSGPLQMWITQWEADYPDPQDWLSIFFGKDADLNIDNYGQNNSDTASKQQAVQQQLAQADVNQDKNARIQAYNDAEQKIVNDVAWISLYQPLGRCLLNPKVRGYEFDAVGITAPDDWGNIYIS